MRIVATADFHGTLPDIPECDLLLIAGDVCPVWDHNRQYQAAWLRGEFYDWCRQQPVKNIVWCAGNHDFVLQNMAKEKTDKLFGHYLQDEEIIIDGLKIWGSPWSPQFGNWAFMKDDRELSQYWRMIPSDVDILMVHGPMYGHGDVVPNFVYRPKLGTGIGTWEDAADSWIKELVREEHVGSISLLNYLTYEAFPKLKLFVFGHIHEGFGQEIAVHGDNQFIAANVSLMNGEYHPVNPVVEFEL